MKQSNWNKEREKRRREYPPPRSIATVEVKKKPEDKSAVSPLSFKIRPPESSANVSVEKAKPVFSIALAMSVVGVILCMGFVAALLWIQEGGVSSFVLSNTDEIEKQSAIPQSELPTPGVRATSTQAARPSPTFTRSSNVKPAAGATATKTSAGRKVTPSATSRPGSTAVRVPTSTPPPTAPPMDTPVRSPTATRRPPTAYPTGSAAPPPPGTCILGCD